MTTNVYFLVGLGATAALYQPFLSSLKAGLPDVTLHTIEWWKTAKYDITNNAVLIGHSGGGVMALRMLDEAPQHIKRIIMLDSHQIHHVSTIPSVADLLAVTLRNSSSTIKTQVEKSYAPLLQDATAFHRAFSETVAWVNSRFTNIAQIIATMPPHSIYHIGFTDNHYIPYEENGKKIEEKLWGIHGIDIAAMPMNHFDLLAPTTAETLTKNIAAWLALRQNQ